MGMGSTSGRGLLKNAGQALAAAAAAADVGDDADAASAASSSARLPTDRNVTWGEPASFFLLLALLLPPGAGEQKPASRLPREEGLRPPSEDRKSVV